ncbi:diguanylate cyclase [Microbacterium sp. OR21]|uniref:diguanylate cyclase domain-containing protein n=1 Tax=Microbacterium sp. OR21 TaxID=3095346 RepID=UPI0039B69375
MITSTLMMPVVVLTTLATVISVGLGFLPRPSRSAALWATAFAIAMVGAYVWLAQEHTAPEQLRALGSGLVITPMPLIWAGLRAYRGLDRQHLAVAFLFGLLAPVTLLLSTFADVYGVALRVVFTAMSVFAALIIVELVRLGPRLRDEALPLLGVSFGFIVFAVIVDVNGVMVMTGAIRAAEGSDSLELVRTLNQVGMAAYIVCALITTLLLTICGDDAAVTPRDAFERTARNRLERAQAADDDGWSLIDIRLDDPDDIRTATSTAAFHAVTERFARDIESVLPADADIDRVTSTRFVALVPRSQGGVRELLTQLLERVSTMEPHHSVPVRLTASIGWAPVSAIGYDFSTLITHADAAARHAYSAGGDRWERRRGDAATRGSAPAVERRGGVIEGRSR